MSLRPFGRVPLQSRGTTQSGVRVYNERLVLSLIRKHGALPKAEIANLTGLSAQTVSVIVRQLETENLLVKGKSLKGKVGQPLQPFSLNPEGAFSTGLKFGRRSGELMLMGFDGSVIDKRRQTYEFIAPQDFLSFVEEGLAAFNAKLGEARFERVTGLGIAEPFEVWKWQEETGAPSKVMDAWKHFDLSAEISRISNLPVLSCNDASAACAAELIFGKGQTVRDFAYIYIGYFVGGGIVIDGKLHEGPSKNAGAIGSMPIPAASGRGEQLIRSASLYLLENSLRAAGRDPITPWASFNSWSDLGVILDEWVWNASRGLAFACASLAATLNCKAVIIDGAMPQDVRKWLVGQTQKSLLRINLSGITPFEVVEGTIGVDARALGAASLPLFDNFMIDRDVLFME